MIFPKRRYAWVLAIYATARGFAFVVFESHLSPIDRGVARRSGSDKINRCVKLIAALVLRHKPDVIVLQDTSATGTRRNPRIAKLNIAIAEFADANSIETYAYSRIQVRHAFSYLGTPTKYAIAEAISKHLPFFDMRLPPPRKRWMAEDTRMGIFDAASLALTYYHHPNGIPPPASAS